MKNKNNGTLMFTAALFTISKMWKPPKCPSRMFGGKDMTHTHHNGILSREIKELLPFVTTWVDPESMMLLEVSQSERDKTVQFHSRVG